MAEHVDRPAHKRALEARLRNVTDDERDFLRSRARLANIVVLKALSRMVDETGTSHFAVKGGVAMELEFGNRARATTDLDVGFRAEARRLNDLLVRALIDPLDGFDFRLAAPGLEPIANTGSYRCKVKVSYTGAPLVTVELEIGMAEGAAGREVRAIDNQLLDVAAIGIPHVDQLPAVTRSYMIAQKLHACTDHSVPDMTNRRARDLIDLILLWGAMDDDERAATKQVCLQIFSERSRHAWPPNVEVVTGWDRNYRAAAVPLGFSPSDVADAAAIVNGIIAEIDKIS